MERGSSAPALHRVLKEGGQVVAVWHRGAASALVVAWQDAADPPSSDPHKLGATANDPPTAATRWKALAAASDGLASMVSPGLLPGAVRWHLLAHVGYAVTGVWRTSPPGPATPLASSGHQVGMLRLPPAP